MLLAIDTSSFVLSCALAEKDKLVAEWTVQKKVNPFRTAHTTYG